MLFVKFEACNIYFSIISLQNISELYISILKIISLKNYNMGNKVTFIFIEKVKVITVTYIWTCHGQSYINLWVKVLIFE